MNLDGLVFRRADLAHVEDMLHIIHRCMHEVNCRDYTPQELERYLAAFTAEWLTDIIKTRHYYEVWAQDALVACGGVSRDHNQQKQSYFTAMFVNPDVRGRGIGRRLVAFLEQDPWCLDSNLIEIPSSKSAHGFYHKCGYQYCTWPPVFSDADGSTILFKDVTRQHCR